MVVRFFRTRVKTNQKYTIPVIPKLEELINKIGPLPCQAFVDDNLALYFHGKSTEYVLFTKYIKRSLSRDIGWSENFTLSPLRLRHTFATRQLNHFGFSLMVVARMLGDTLKIFKCLKYSKEIFLRKILF